MQIYLNKLNYHIVCIIDISSSRFKYKKNRKLEINNQINDETGNILQ